MQNVTHDLDFLDLVRLCGFDASCKSKLVRHQDARFDLDELYRSGWLETYQAFQGKPVFDGCERIVSFIGMAGTHAKFFGVFEVGDRAAGASVELPANCPHPEWLKSPYHYRLSRIPGFEALEGRVVIDWGRATRSWHQGIRSKPVVEVLPAADAVPIFRDYQGFVLSHRELAKVFSDPEVHREWRARLSAVAGIYLVLDTLAGLQYVGSAHGQEGIWGRWAQYAKNGHAGNRLLRELVTSDPRYPSAFQFSLLHVLPKSLTRKEVIDWEGVHKHKLGSRAVGLNLN